MTKNTQKFVQNVVAHDDTSNVLPYIPSNSIHLTFTAQPYFHFPDYSYKEYLDYIESVFEDVYRSTIDGGILVLNTAPITVSYGNNRNRRHPVPFDIHSRLSKIGWEFIDDIQWIKPKGYIARIQQIDKNRISEYLMVYRKNSSRFTDWKPEDFEHSSLWSIQLTTNTSQLSNQIIRRYSCVGDLVFDPFPGSGDVAQSAFSNNRLFFVVEPNLEHVSYIREKIGDVHVTDSDELANFDEKPA